MTPLKIEPITISSLKAKIKPLDNVSFGINFFIDRCHHIVRFFINCSGIAIHGSFSPQYRPFDSATGP
jgi:hypothetical protein